MTIKQALHDTIHPLVRFEDGLDPVRRERYRCILEDTGYHVTSASVMVESDPDDAVTEFAACEAYQAALKLADLVVHDAPSRIAVDRLLDALEPYVEDFDRESRRFRDVSDNPFHHGSGQLRS